jgi:hypothetical protein
VATDSGVPVPDFPLLDVPLPDMSVPQAPAVQASGLPDLPTPGERVPLPPRRPPSKQTEDEFARVAAGMDGLRIDGTDLSAIKQYLEAVAQLTRNVQDMVDTANRTAQAPGDPAGHSFGHLGHGAIGGVAEIGSRLQSTARSMDRNLARFATSMNRTAEAIATIAKLYRTADERNKLDAEQVRRHFKS